jgi:hypothetical protein
MPPIVQYLVKLSLSLAIISLFYYFVLRRLTFYKLNRWYLAGYSFLCFFIASIDVSGVLYNNEKEAKLLVRLIPSVESLAVPLLPAAGAPTTLPVWTWVLLLFYAGVAIAFTRLFVQLFSYWKLRRSALSLTKTPVPVYQINKEIIPFSFGTSIFINQDLHTEEELKEIIRHEFVHVKEAHTIDVIWAEILCIINWYNPFAWLLRHHIRQNLEFIADDKLVQSGIDKKDYQYLLLKVIGSPQFRIVNNFNFSSLKKRIIMMNRLKSAKVHLVKFLFVLPVAVVLLVAFRKADEHRQKPEVTGITFSQDEHRVAMEGSPADTIGLPEDYAAFLRKNKAVKKLVWKENAILVYFKKGGYEEYRLDDENRREQFVKLYGAIPAAPPPPPDPPTPPTPPGVPDVPRPAIPPIAPIPPDAPERVEVDVSNVVLPSIGLEKEIQVIQNQMRVLNGMQKKLRVPNRLHDDSLMIDLELVQQQATELKALSEEFQKHALSKEVNIVQLSKQEMQKIEQKAIDLEQVHQKLQLDLHNLQKEALPRQTINELNTKINGLENKLRVLKNANEILEEEIKELNKQKLLPQTPAKKD